MSVSSSLVCPACEKSLITLHITGHDVRCPACGHVMFAFLRDGETLTRGLVFAKYDSELVHWIKLARPWMRLGHEPAASLLVRTIFARIAQELPE